MEIMGCAEMEALSAICDTLLPSITIHPHQNPNSDHSVHLFYQTSASMAGTPHHIGVLLRQKLKHPKMYLIRLSLWLLSTGVGTFILCGKKSLSSQYPYFQKFAKISQQDREEIMLSWSDSSFLLLRMLFAAFKIFTLLLYFTQVNDRGENMSWKAIGYCNIERQTTKSDAEQQLSEEDKFGPLTEGIISLNQSKQVSFTVLLKLGFPVSIPYPKRDIAFTIKCDVVVVGSGSGGGVVAGVLAKAGYKVLVLEKGSYLARTNLTLLEGQAMDQMYLGHGILGTKNMNVLLLAGSTVGGGSTINWAASIQTPQHVMEEWSEDHGLKLFSSKAYEKALDVVCQRMGVQTEFDDEGFNNMVLRRGCENLGFPVETIPRNAPSDHYCGSCCLGCKDGKKKGVSETWLVDLVESGNGVILPECDVVKVITRKRKGKKNAIGVAFVFTNHGVKETAIVEADVTVVACGAIHTPPLLRRSGLKNTNIGKNLHLHPVVMGWGYFPDAWPEANKKSFEGGIMTAMSKVDIDHESSCYGTIIQTPSLHPGMFSALMPWLSGRDIRNRMLKFSRTAHIFALARDKGSGMVSSQTDINYKMAKSDEENMSKGVENVLRILVAAGAKEIGTHHMEGKVLKVNEATEEELERFVKEESSKPLSGLSRPMCSAHQMGSCRMGTNPKGSVVAPTGETWEVEGLYVADSSVFPSALGVNPMVTIQAIAYCIAQSLIEALEKRKSS